MADLKVIVQEPGPVSLVQVAIQGPPGPPGTDVNFTQSFFETASVLVEHYLGKLPSVMVLDTAGTTYLCEVQHHNLNTCTVTMAQPMTGTVICN